MSTGIVLVAPRRGVRPRQSRAAGRRTRNGLPLINVGCGEDQTIADLARAVASVVGFRGVLEFDTSKPDGTPRKLLDIGRLRKLGWSPGIDLKTGIAAAYRDFLVQEGGLSPHRGAMSGAKP